MNYLALDLSKRSTGWAVWPEGSDTARFGHWELGSEYTSDAQTFCKLHTMLAELHSVFPFERMFIEEPVNQNHMTGFTTIQTIRLLSGLAAHAHSFAHAYNLPPVQEINVSSWRSDFIGRIDNNEAKAQARRAKKAGNSKASATDALKALTMERCKQLGFKPRKTDEADAIGILTYSILLRGETPPWLAREVLQPPLMMEAAR